MAKETQVLSIENYHGGIVRDARSQVEGSAATIEELDIFENRDFIRPAQIFSSDSMPANTEIYAYTSGKDSTVYGYGKRTDNSDEVRLVSVSNGGNDNPGSFSTLFTSADTGDNGYIASDVQYFEADNVDKEFLLYVTVSGTTVRLKTYDINANTESETDEASTDMELTGLDGSFDKISMKFIFGDVYITNGSYIAKFDLDGIFTEKDFTLPIGWNAVDIAPISDKALILCEYTDRNANFSKAFWWDLQNESQFDDSFGLPMGGPQWLVNDHENIRMLCAKNGRARIYQLAGAFAGAAVNKLPNILLTDVADDTSDLPASPAKTVGSYDDTLYFGLNKTTNAGVYAIGKIDSDANNAVMLARRYDTTDYSNHQPVSHFTSGPNFYGSFDDNGTHKHVRCETNNSPSRSSNAIYESVWFAAGDASVSKDVLRTYLSSFPLPSGTSLDLYFKSDYDQGSFTQVQRPNNTVFNDANGFWGFFRPNDFKDIKTWKVKVEFSSSGSDAPKLTGIHFKVLSDELPESE